MARYAIATAAARRTAKARIACSRPGFFFALVAAGAAGGVESLRALFAAASDDLIADDLGAERFVARCADCFGAVSLGVTGAGSGLLGLLAVAAAVVEVGLGGGGAARARALALRSRISLRCARDGFLLTIRRYSKQVRSGKTPALWGMKPPTPHNVAPAS